MQKGDFVRLNYVGRLESGEVFDLTLEETAKKEKIYNEKIKYKPVPIIVGVGFVIPGLDDGLLKMKVGEKKEIEISPENAFGPRKNDMIKIVPENSFKEKPSVGMVVDFNGMKGRIQSVNAGRVRVDFNSPLAGKKLKYDIEITEKIEDPEKQIRAVFEFFGSENITIIFNDNSVDIGNAKIPEPMKKKISSFIKDYVKNNDKKIEKVKFVEEF